MDQRQVIQKDPAQVKSINDFTSSLAKTLVDAEGMPSKELTRELLADGLRRALDMLGETPKKQFLEILAANIHKFALQEQYSLSRVYPVEISSEYKNLQSFFSEAAPEEATGEDRAEPTALSELRRMLAALPQRAGISAEEFVAKVKDEDSSQALKAVNARTRSAFFAEVRQSLYRFSEASQKELVEFFTELKAEVVKLVDSMTQEVSVWLDEERVASAWQNHAKQASLRIQAQNLFQAVLSPSFQTNFKQIGSGAKRAKEAFLLQTAVCLKTGAEKLYWDSVPGLLDLAAQMRRSFFYVEGYGELMEDWLQSRTTQINQEFLQRGTAILGSNFSEVVSRLRQIFRPGRWMFLSDPRVEGDLITLFLEDSIPRHVLSMTSLTKLLELVGSNGGDDFHIYNDIVRLPPLSSPALGPQDLTESALLEVLKRLPCFPPLQRLVGPGGRYRFGRMEVVFQLTATELAAQVVASPLPVPEVLRALDFFVQFGPQEYPTATVDAVKASDQLMCGTTQILDLNAPMPTLPNLGFQMLGAPIAPLGSLGAIGPGPVPQPMGSLAMPAFSGPKFGIDDDEI